MGRERDGHGSHPLRQSWYCLSFSVCVMSPPGLKKRPGRSPRPQRRTHRRSLQRYQAGYRRLRGLVVTSSHTLTIMVAHRAGLSRTKAQETTRRHAD
jgi:hypothetical protein